MKQRNAFGKKSLDLLNCYLSKEAITFLQVVLERNGDFTLAVDPKIIFRVKWLKKPSTKTIARARARVSHRARPNTSSIYKWKAYSKLMKNKTAKETYVV